MLTRKMIVGMFMLVLVSMSLGWAERTYEYIEEVGEGYEHETINEAIDAMNENEPNEDALGCIRVYLGDYKETLNDAADGNNLPAHCDLIGMGTDISDVNICTGYCGGDAVRGVNCLGDNIISNLKISDIGPYWHYGILFNGDGTFDNCFVDVAHAPAVEGLGHLIVKGKDTLIRTKYGGCIHAKSTFEIYDCELVPTTCCSVGESPTGIWAYGSGIIDHVLITADFATDTPTNLTGIKVDYQSSDAIVKVYDTTILLKLTSEYNPSNHGAMRLRGIALDNGYAIVEDCTIELEGIEDDNGGDDGAGIKVSGILTRHGAQVDILGSTSISTSRTVASYGEDGHEYLLNNGCGFIDDGLMYVDFSTVTFDPNGDDEPDEYDPAYVCGSVDDYKVKNITQDTNHFFIQDALNDANDGDVIEAKPSVYFETVDFNGISCVLTSADPNDWDIVARTIVDADYSSAAVIFDSNEDANSVITGFTVRNGNVGVKCQASSPVVSCCIIEDNVSGGIDCNSVGSPTITRNKVRANGGYGGIYISNSVAPVITNNWIYDNSDGIGFDSATSAAIVRNNTIVDNDGNGIYVSSGTAPTVTNCILWNNGDDLQDCNATYSCISDCNDVGNPNVTHNICLDPNFVDSENDDYHIHLYSSCVDNGEPNTTGEGQKDIDGEPRRMDLDGETRPSSIVDMGADEVIGKVHNINQDTWYLGIQEAINYANDTDEIVVYPGTYDETIVIDSLSITLRSRDLHDWDTIANTVIKGQGIQVVKIDDSNCTVAGFRIDASSAYLGIYCTGTSQGTVSYCLVQNFALMGIRCASTSSSTIQNNKICGSNDPCDETFGIECVTSEPVIIENNWVYNSNYGIVISDANSEGTVRNNTVVGNSEAGIGVYSGNAPVISNCIVWDNGDDLYNCSSTHSCIKDVNDANGLGNITSDPCFIDADSNDFHLDTSSPCIDAGDPNGDYTGQTDIDGNCRDVNGVDIGADEVCVPTTYSTYDDWVTLGKPDCWCQCYQCDGDAAGDTEVIGWRVYGSDLFLVDANWKKTIDDPTLDPCADIDHKGQIIDWRVYTNDLNRLTANWKKTDPELPGDCPRDE